MASFTTPRADLMALSGVKLLTNIDQKHPDEVYCCIPCRPNEIKALQEHGKTVALIPLALWPMRNREAYLQKVNQTNIANGDPIKTLDDIPTHELKVNHSEQWVLDQINYWGKDRITQACLAKQSPAYAEQIKDGDPLDSNSSLFKAIKGLFDSRIARMFSHSSEKKEVAAQATSVAQGVSGYTAPTEQPADPYASYGTTPAEDEDLPF